MRATSTLRATAAPRLIQVALVVTAGLGVLAGLQVAQAFLATDPLSDVRAYYEAGRRLNEGLPLYDQPAGVDDAEYYRYPPLLALAFRPLALLPAAAAALVWQALVLVSFGLILWRLGLSIRTWVLLGLLGVPIGWALAIGQAHVPMTLLMLLGTPLSIAVAANLKVLPALLAIWWIARRDWTSVQRFAAWCGVLAAVQLALAPAASLAFPAAFSLEQVGEVRNFSPYVVSPLLWLVLVGAGTVVAARLATSRYGWAAAVALSVLATPRLLLYQLMALLAAAREPAGRPGGSA